VLGERVRNITDTASLIRQTARSPCAHGKLSAWPKTAYRLPKPRPHLWISADWLVRQTNSRPPTGIAPRPGVGYQSYISPSSMNYNWDKGCDGATFRFMLPVYHGLRQKSNALSERLLPSVTPPEWVRLPPDAGSGWGTSRSHLTSNERGPAKLKCWPFLLLPL